LHCSSLEPNSAAAGSQPLPAPPAPAGTQSFRLENDKSPCATSSYSIGNTYKNTLKHVPTLSPANDAGPKDPDDDPFPSTFYDVIPAPLLART